MNLNLRYVLGFLIFYYWNKSICNTVSKNWQSIRKNHNSRRFVYLQELLYIHTDHMHRPNKSPAFLSQNVSPLHSRRIPPNHLYQLLFHQSVLRQVQVQYLRLDLVFVWSSAQREKFSFCFHWQGDWALGYHSLGFRKFPDIF